MKQQLPAHIIIIICTGEIFITVIKISPVHNIILSSTYLSIL